MSKFKCTENSRDFVEVLRDREGRLAVAVADNHTSSVAFLDPTDAPALALAILEAAGVEAKPHEAATVPYGTPAHLEMIASHLKVYAEAKSMNDAQAEAQAKLEAEALELAKAGCEAVGDESAQKLSDMTYKDQRFFLAIARSAREINKEEK